MKLSQPNLRSRHTRRLPHSLARFDDAGALVEFKAMDGLRLRRRSTTHGRPESVTAHVAAQEAQEADIVDISRHVPRRNLN